MSTRGKCPLYPKKQSLAERTAISARRQKQTSTGVTIDDIFSSPWRYGAFTSARQATGILAKVSGGFGLGGTFGGGGCRMDGLNHESRA